MMEWQPIETAPKDGTTVIIALSGRVLISRFTSREIYENGKLEHRYAKWFLPWPSGIGENEPQPTHWMPLPELPAPSSTG